MGLGTTTSTSTSNFGFLRRREGLGLALRSGGSGETVSVAALECRLWPFLLYVRANMVVQVEARKSSVTTVYTSVTLARPRGAHVA